MDHSGFGRSRAYKVTLQDHAIDNQCKIIKDSENLDLVFPSLIDKLSVLRSDIRFAALQSLNEIISSKFIAQELSNFIDDLFHPLLDIITENHSEEEKNEALKVFCNLALNMAYDMEEYSMELLNELMPKIQMTKTEDRQRFFTIAVVSSLTLKSDENIERVLIKFLDLLTNKKSRGVEFDGETISILLNAVSFILSIRSFDSDVIDKAELAVDICMENKNVDVVMSALDLVEILHELEYRNDFGAKYKNKLSNVEERFDRKQDKKVMRDKINEVIDLFNTGSINEEITLSGQFVVLRGARSCYFVKIVRLITAHHFSNMMSSNKKIQQILDVEIDQRQLSVKEKRLQKQELDHNRNVNKREREIALSKDRKKKHSRMESSTRI